MAKAMVPDREMEKRVDPGRGKIIHTEDGSEDHSQSGGPMAAALRVTTRDGLGDRVRELIRSERMAIAAEQAGYETFEESDDFEVDDEQYDPQTPYEEIFDGSIAEDVATRQRQQEEALQKIDPKALRQLIGKVDPKTLDSVLRDMGVLQGPPPSPPATGEDS